MRRTFMKAVETFASEPLRIVRPESITIQIHLSLISCNPQEVRTNKQEVHRDQEITIALPDGKVPIMEQNPVIKSIHSVAPQPKIAFDNTVISTAARITLMKKTSSPLTLISFQQDQFVVEYSGIGINAED